MSEVRATSESGGQKGRKEEQYSLVPIVMRRHWLMNLMGSGRLSEQEYETLSRMLDAEEASTRELLVRVLTDTRHLLMREIAEQYGPFAVGSLMAVVYGRGATKYPDAPGRLNYQKGYPFSWTIDSFWRHYIAKCNGEEMDPEQKVPHVCAALWHVNAVLEFLRLNVGVDDRCYRAVAA